MNTTLENELLGQLILSPALLESTEDITASSFSPGDARTAFSGISAQWEELRPRSIDIQLLARKTGLSEGWLLGLTNGNFRPDPATFAARLTDLKRKRIGARIQEIAWHEGQHLTKTGDYDDTQLKELEGLFAALKGNPKGGAAFKRLSNVEGRDIEWLWRGRIPRGMLTLLAGDPGLGKSFLATWLASRLSAGLGLPDDPGRAQPGSTIYLSAEDSAAYALQPRAAKNGADLARILVLEGSSFDIAEDLEKVRAIAKTNPDARLLIIDPLNSYIGEADYFKDPAVRAKLNPLVQFAEEKGIAVLAVMHLNKKTDQAGIYRIGGSIAFAGIARSILAVTQDPEDPDRRFLRPLKMNYCRKPDPLAFRIGPDLTLAFEDGPADIGADESLSAPTGRESAEGSFAARWLTDYLAGGASDLADIFSASRPLGISRSALFRARDRLGIKSRTLGFGKGRPTSWELPESHQSQSRVS